MVKRKLALILALTMFAGMLTACRTSSQVYEEEGDGQAETTQAAASPKETETAEQPEETNAPVTDENGEEVIPETAAPVIVIDAEAQSFGKDWTPENTEPKSSEPEDEKPKSDILLAYEKCLKSYQSGSFNYKLSDLNVLGYMFYGEAKDDSDFAKSLGLPGKEPTTIPDDFRELKDDSFKEMFACIGEDSPLFINSGLHNPNETFEIEGAARGTVNGKDTDIYMLKVDGEWKLDVIRSNVMTLREYQVAAEENAKEKKNK